MPMRTCGSQSRPVQESCPVADTRISAVGLWAVCFSSQLRFLGEPPPLPLHTHTVTPGRGCPSSHVHRLPQHPSRVQHKSHPGSGWVPTAAPLLRPLRPGSPWERLLPWLGAGSCLFYVALTFFKFLLPAF